MVIPADYDNIVITQIEMISNYCELKVKIVRSYEMPKENIKVVLVVAGALGSTSLKFKEYFDQLGVKYSL